VDNSWLALNGTVPRLELHYDPKNHLARQIYGQLRAFEVPPNSGEPDLIVPIGGDGYMMHCVRRHWRRFIPFFGVNAGHVGFLLNDAALLEELLSAPLRLHLAPMLYCKAVPLTSSGNTPDPTVALAFNDAWIERASGQTARLSVRINGIERGSNVRGDGILVSTAAGSTAYAQALGGSPLPVGAPILQLVGSNCTYPPRWRPVHLNEDVQVELRSLDTEKRPCRAFVDSVDLGLVQSLSARASRVAGVQLAFTYSCDLQSKLYKMQFPSG
jgi:NAD+ kinase